MRVLVAVLLLALASVATAKERIDSFHSRVEIQADATLRVTETIRVQSEGVQMKRGIFRDFPTDYRDKHGNKVRVGFDVSGVLRDGASEPWFTERQANGVRLYIGSKSRKLPPGAHEYVISYRTTRQVGFFPDHDELYWNVTGNGWDFAIREASADVTLPRSVPAADLRMEGWTGYPGSRQRAVETGATDGTGSIRTTRVLSNEEGLTLAFTFPKGIVPSPTAMQRVQWWAEDNKGLVTIALGFLLLWAYYYWRWWLYGRDPEPGVVMPQYEAPDDLPPSVLRYVRDMDYASPTFVSDLMHLAERGFLRIENNAGFSLTRLRSGDEAGTIGARTMAKLFHAAPIFEFDSSAWRVLGPARSDHKKRVEATNKNGRWFRTNKTTHTVGIAASTLLVVVGLALQGGSNVAIPGCVLALVLAIAAAVAVGQAWKALHRHGGARVGHALGALIALAVAAAAGLGIAVIAGTVMFALVAGLALMNPVFGKLLPAYSQEGRRLVDRIEGFRNYLSVAEKDDLARQKEPPLTGERFAQFLPYAHALDVEKAWADKLVAAVGATAAEMVTQQSVGTWYATGSNRDYTPSRLADSFNSSFASAISSSSTPPGSSSGGGYSGGSSGGGGGGGSSGGGGGGGGGGGW